MESQKIKNLLDHQDEDYPIKLRSGMLLMTEIMVSMMKVMEMINQLKLIHKL